MYSDFPAEFTQKEEEQEVRKEDWSLWRNFSGMSPFSSWAPVSLLQPEEQVSMEAPPTAAST